jgi:hypothetical protein
MIGEISTASGDAAQSARWIRRLMVINLVLVAVQPISAGFFLSGYARAVAVHADAALALQLGALVQAIMAVTLWRRHREPTWFGGFSIGLLVMVFLEMWLGHHRLHWLHVPLGVGIFGALTRRVNLPGHRSSLSVH